MERAMLLVGKLGLEQGSLESYQLLIKCSYIDAVYDASEERETFYDELSDAFVKMILAERSRLVVGVVNGIRIDPEKGNHEFISPLEEILVSRFSELVCYKLGQVSITIPVPSSN